MAENKTKAEKQPVSSFISSIPEKQKREDSQVIADLMQKVTGEPPVMWGTAIVGFGNQHYEYESGRSGDWFIIGFSPRKQNLTLYGLGAQQKQEALLQKLGKHKTGKGCLYINKLEDIDMKILQQMIETAVKGKK